MRLKDRGTEINVECRQLLIIGLDGATFDLIGPWVAAGDLPNLGRLMETGVWGPLQSTLPPMTFPAWSTMMTGVNPGRHGVFDFTRRHPDRYAIEFVNATYRRRPTLWRLLSDAGYRVGVMGLPATYPPEPVNGFLIAGFDAPVTIGIDSAFVYPSELYDEIREMVGEYRIADFQELHIGPGWHADALAKLQVALRDRTAIGEYLLSKESWDCFMIHFGESDTVSHHYWIFHDPASPRSDMARNDYLRFSEAIRTIYRQLDTAIGQLIAAVPEATVIVLSDHGFGGSGDKVIYLNRWLAEQGFLNFKDGPNLLGRSVQLGKRLGLHLLPSSWQEQIFRRCNGWLADRVESTTRFGGLDWAKTQAFSEESNTCPAIWLNVAGREPQGSVHQREYGALRDEIIGRLESWVNPANEQRIVARAWRREELYQGPYVNEAPDIILELALDNGYTFSCQSSQGRPGPALRQLTPAEYVGAKGQSMNGSHRSNGVLIMAGPGIQAGRRLTDANLLDIAPTILALIDHDDLYEMDGRILSEALTEPSAISNQSKSSDLIPALAPIRTYSSAEAALVEDRLRALGYLE